MYGKEWKIYFGFRLKERKIIIYIFINYVVFFYVYIYIMEEVQFQSYFVLKWSQMKGFIQQYYILYLCIFEKNIQGNLFKYVMVENDYVKIEIYVFI